MITITNKYVKEGKLNKEALATLGADVVKITGNKIIFGDVVEFYKCDFLNSIDGVYFHSDVYFFHCPSLKSLAGATFEHSVFIHDCPNLKQ